MNHAQYRPRFSALLFRVHHDSLIHRRHFFEAVRRDQLRSVVLRNTMEPVQRLWKTSRVQAIDVNLELTSLFEFVNLNDETYHPLARVLSVFLFQGKSVLIPVV